MGDAVNRGSRRQAPRRPRAASLGLSLVIVVSAAAACGSGDSETGEAIAVTKLEEAFAEASASSGHRVRAYAGQTLVAPSLGLSVDSPLDPTNPFSEARVDADGDVHTTVDIAGVVPTALDSDELVFEIWESDTQIVGDTTNFEAITEINPSADLGPFAPGRWSIDVAEVSADSDEIAAMMSGSAVLDPSELGRAFLADIDDVREDPDNPSHYTASTTYGQILRAGGQDPATVARAASTGIAANFGVDPVAVGELYAEVYESAPTTMSFVLADGELESFEVVADLSGIWGALFERSSELDLDMTDADRAALEEAATDSTFEVHLRSEFDADPTITVELPTEGLEDRTAAFADWFAAVAGD